jgi:hypothetical protein
MELDSDAPRERASLKAPPVLTPGVVACLALGLLFVLGLWSTPDVPVRDRWVTTGFIVVMGLAPLLLSWRFAATAGVRSLALFPDRLRLPVTIRALQSLNVPLSEVNGLLLYGEGRRGLLLIGTPSFEFIYPLSAFTHPDEARRFVRAVQEQLAVVLPHGERAVQALEDEAQRVGPALAQRPWVTWIAAGFPVAVVLVLGGLGVTAQPFGALVFGGLSQQLALDGQLWRVLTYAYVYPPSGFGLPLLQVLPPVPLVLHGVGLLIVGPTLERMAGHGRAALCVLGGSLVGGLLVLAFGAATVVAGGAASVFATLSALLFLGFQHRGKVPLGFRASGRTWMWSLIVGLFLILQPEVTLDLAIGGALTGVLVAATTGARLPVLHTPPALSAVAGVLLVASVTALGYATTIEHGPETQAHVVEQSDDAERLNAFAWQMALKSDPTSDELELAEDAARKSIGLPAPASTRASVRDTLATVLYRQGRFIEAAREEHGVLGEQPNPHAASQLARFLDAARTAGLSVDTSSAALQLSTRLTEDGRVAVTPQWSVLPSRHVTVFAWVIDAAGSPKVVLRIPFVPENAALEHTLDTPEAVAIEPDDRTEVLWVRDGGDASKLWPFADRVRDYPAADVPG